MTTPRQPAAGPSAIPLQDPKEGLGPPSAGSLCECGNRFCIGADAATAGHYYRLYEREKAGRETAERKVEVWALREAALVERGIRTDAEQLCEKQDLERRLAAAEARADVAERKCRSMQDGGEELLDKLAQASEAISEERRRALRDALDEVRAEQDQWLNVPAFRYIIDRMEALLLAASDKPPAGPSASLSEALTGKEGPSK